jgi:hypothetical protein
LRAAEITTLIARTRGRQVPRAVRLPGDVAAPARTRPRRVPVHHSPPPAPRSESFNRADPTRESLRFHSRPHREVLTVNAEPSGPNASGAAPSCWAPQRQDGMRSTRARRTITGPSDRASQRWALRASSVRRWIALCFVSG